jgi:hypothetical protein
LYLFEIGLSIIGQEGRCALKTRGEASLYTHNIEMRLHNIYISIMQTFHIMSGSGAAVILCVQIKCRMRCGGL